MNETSAGTDVAAMLRLRGGDDLALNELMSRWQEPLVRFLYRYTANPEEALDLAQETFVRVYEHRARYDARGNFSTWLYTIAANLCRNQARWKKRHPTISMDAPGSMPAGAKLGEQLPDSGPNPSRAAAEHELADAVRDAIQALPDDQRTATILFEYEEQSHAEIAVVIGCTAKAVENKLRRAREKLRMKLNSWL